MNFAFCNLNSESFCNRNLTLHLMALVMCLPFSLVPKLRFFVTSAQIAGLFILTTIFSILTLSTIHLGREGISKSVNFLNISNFGEFFGVVCFSVEGFGLVLPIRSTMVHKERFKSVFFTVCFVVVIFYLIFGAIASLAYGKDLKTVILMNYDHGFPIIYFQSLLYAVGIFISFPYVIFPLSPSLRKTNLLKQYVGVSFIVVLTE